MEFYIPLSQEDLLKQRPSNEYYVHELYDEVEINEYSKGHSLHFNELCAFLQDELNSQDRGASIDNRRDHRNTLQMNVYLLSQFVDKFENQFTKMDQNVSFSAKGKRGRKVTKDVPDDWISEWNEQKSRLLQCFVMLMQQPLNLLWDPPIIDEQFVTCIANICYKLFENPETGKSRTNNDDAIELLGILIQNYRHHSTAGIKIVQQLQHFEHLPSFWASTVARFVSKFYSQNIVLEIFRELASAELDDLTKEGASARNYATFLVELAEKSPTVVLAHVSLLMCHLDAECYTMRNCVLTVLAELIMKKLQGEHLATLERQNRDRFLDRLEVHLHDKNAFCRSRCLQLWTKICETNSIPTSRLKSLMPLVIGRLVDKGCTVRKGAIQLLTTILRNNPYMAKLSLDDVRKKFDDEKEKLSQMQREKRPVDQKSKEHEIIRRADQQWAEIIDEVASCAETWINLHYNEGVLDSTVCVGDLLDCDVILKAIFQMLTDGEYPQACAFTVVARQTWPEHRVFQTTNNRDEEMLAASLESVNLTLLEHMKNIFLEHLVAQNLSAKKDVGSEAEIDEYDDDDDEEDDLEEEDKFRETDSPDLQQQRRLVRYLRDSKIFAEQLQTVLPQVSMMLRQTQTSDVLESIEFVVTCAEFGVKGSRAAVWKCCSLIWSRETAIKEAVVRAFQRLFLNVDDATAATNSKLKYGVVAQNLIELVLNANLSQVTCLEDVVCELMKHKMIHSELLQLLWEKFAGKNATPFDESKAALKLLGMATKAEKSIVKENFDLLVRCGLGEKAQHSFEFARDACVALEKLGQLDKRKLEEVVKQEPFRLPAQSDVFVRLQNLVVAGFTNLDDVLWTPMMEHAIKVIYLLAEHPDSIAASILQLTCDVLKSSSNAVTFGLLTRFVSLIGQTALQTFIFVDVTMCRELKRRNLIREERKLAKDNKKKGRKSLLATPRSTVSKRGDLCEEEMALAGASVEDVELEYVTKICEDEILAETTILGKLSKLVVEICKNQQKYTDADLQAAALLALSKLMIVSSKFCESHLSLLFTRLERSELPSVRANIIIAIGDLSFRFPNLIEPWTSTVYKRLNDRDLNVRLNCLLVLNHLILNDMIKPKGHVADIALCTLDGSQQVASLAKKFFVEYAEKGNSLYNLLPDIISRLSDSETKIDSDDFKTIMKLLFSLIHKERQYESLIEKLCQRFQGTRSVEQWRYFSYCLSLPTYNERCLKKLSENLACYATQLYDKEVFANFISVINAAKKSTKFESKTFVEELESKLVKLHNKTSEDEEMVAKVAGVKIAPEAPKRRKKRTNSTRRYVDEDDDDGENENDDDDNVVVESNEQQRERQEPTRRSTRLRTVSSVGATSRRFTENDVIVESDDE